MSHPNKDLVHRYFKAADSSDLDTLHDLFTDDIVAHIAGGHSLSGDYEGKAAVFGFFGQLAERSDGTARLHLREALADDWFAVALVAASAQVGDQAIDQDPAALVFRIENGRFAEMWSHHYDQPKMNRIWSQLRPPFRRDLA